MSDTRTRDGQVNPYWILTEHTVLADRMKFGEPVTEKEISDVMHMLASALADELER